MSYRNEPPLAVQGLLDGDAGWVYLDVRTAEEFAEGHAPGAWNVPVAERDAAGRMQANPGFVDAVARHFPVDARLVVGCAAGHRSARACEMLAAAGYRELVNLAGGFMGSRDPSGRIAQPGWTTAGLSIEVDGDAERTWERLK